MSEIIARLFVVLQRLLPKYVMTAIVFRVSRLKQVSIKNLLIRQFVRLYSVETKNLVHPVPDGFATLNDFFIRELAAGARPVDEDPVSITSPVDGTVSACGLLDGNRLLQVKGLHYALADLLATDIVDAERYIDGSFATIYLAPFNYHRVHAPCSGELTAVRYIPGTLFSVNDSTVRHLPQLFARNERITCQVKTGFGPMIVLFVGALNVGTINTIWTGDIRPRRNGVVEAFNLNDVRSGLQFDKGETIGWFNMGSTVILIAPPGTTDNFETITAGQTLRMGDRIGRFQSGQ
ncbi:MAG: archaetidylserine decarboxylase [Gammaproteobacteria bacterium]|nr:archaetidylserine decarboxylase [Gammaproteobacteria bacterium]